MKTRGIASFCVLTFRDFVDPCVFHLEFLVIGIGEVVLVHEDLILNVKLKTLNHQLNLKTLLARRYSKKAYYDL